MSTKKDSNLEIEVLVPDEIIINDESLKDRYNPKTKKLVYDENGLIPKEISQNIKELLSESQAKEIVALNPIIIALVELQEIKSLKYDPENEKETVQAFKDSKRIVGSFNSSLAAAKKILKQPHIDYNKKVDEINRVFKQESDAVKEALFQNFDPYLKEQERIKKAKEDAKKQEELERIAALSKQNEENLLKIKNQEKEKADIQIHGKLNNLVSVAAEKSSTLNLDGLKSLLAEYEDLVPFNYIYSGDQINLFSEEEQQYFERLYSDKYKSAVNIINNAIESIIEKERVAELDKENAVLKAKTPQEVFKDDQDDDPFSQINDDLPQEEEAPNNDLKAFEILHEYIYSLNESVKNIEEAISKIKFQDKNVEAYRNKIKDKSMPVVLDYTSKMLSWTESKKNLYINYLKQN